jgi:tetratricopeptide (TPR) repeat protein
MSARDEEARNAEKWDAAEEGAERLREGDVEGAIRELERVIKGDRDNEYAYYFLGAAHFERGAFDKALKAYLEALRIAPGYLGAMVGLGHTLRLLGRHQDAIRVAHQILARVPEDSDALYLLGLAHMARGERAAAIDAFDRFLRTRPELEVASEVRALQQILRGEIHTKTDPRVN